MWAKNSLLYCTLEQESLLHGASAQALCKKPSTFEALWCLGPAAALNFFFWGLLFSPPADYVLKNKQKEGGRLKNHGDKWALGILGAHTQKRFYVVCAFS